MNGWPKNVPKMKTLYYKHPTHGYDQHDDQPTYPKLRPCTRNIQLMDIHKRTRRSIVQLHICLELGSVEWIVQLNDVQLQTWSLQKIAPKTKKSYSMTKGFVKVPWIYSKWEIIYQLEITHAEFKLYTPFMRAVRTRIQFYCTWKSR